MIGIAVTKTYIFGIGQTKEVLYVFLVFFK